MNYTLGEIVRNSVSKNSDYPALGFVGENSYTYGEMLVQIESVMAFLEQQGIRKGDKVAFYQANNPIGELLFLLLPLWVQLLFQYCRFSIK